MKFIIGALVLVVFVQGCNSYHDLMMKAGPGECRAVSLTTWSALERDSWDTWVMRQVDALCVHPWTYLTIYVPFFNGTIGEAWRGSASGLLEAHIATEPTFGWFGATQDEVVIHEAAHLWGYRVGRGFFNEELAEQVVKRYRARRAPPRSLLEMVPQ